MTFHGKDDISHPVPSFQRKLGSILRLLLLEESPEQKAHSSDNDNDKMDSSLRWNDEQKHKQPK
jgi:hypothetical protein